MRRLIINTSRSTATAKKPSFHKRPLPSTLTAMASPSGKQIFKEALASGGMESYFPLAEQFVTQSEPSFCSLSSLSMVLNALNFDPKKVWKGAWRWVSEETLQCESTQICGHSLEAIKTDGLSFHEFESLARCHGVRISGHRVLSDGTEVGDTEEGSAEEKCPEGIDKFRKLVEQISMDDQAETFIVVNFSRKILNQTGDGHFSPIGGYHKEKELVLIMDVARFKYPPYWVPIKDLWAAMAEPDLVTSEPRGYFIISGWNDKPMDPDTIEEFINVQEHMHNIHHDHSHVHSEHCSHGVHGHGHVSYLQDPATRSLYMYTQPSSNTYQSSGTSKVTAVSASGVQDGSGSNGACPRMIRTWENAKRYVPKQMCCTKHQKMYSPATEESK